VIKDTVEYREKNNIHRKDFMHLLLQLKNRGKLVDDGSILNDKDNKGEDTALTMNELAAQAFVFFLAGFETSSTTMTFCLFELASNPDIQEKLRQEVNDILDKYDNKLTYDGVMEMHYMEKVINETLRKYPPLPGLNRVCTKDYHVPGTDFIIEKGTKVMIPVLGIQRDPEHYPDPEKFDPERFSEENKKTRHPYTFLPFGEGPRICIGLRFGMVQTKVGLTILLKNYKFSLGSKTALPLKFDPKSFIMTTEGGIWLDYATIND
jgi:cytochrome P450 family 6